MPGFRSPNQDPYHTIKISDETRRNAVAAKKMFLGEFPEVEVSIDITGHRLSPGTDGFILVDGKKAVNISGGRKHLTANEMLDKMKQSYLGEGTKMKTTKRQLKRIIKEEHSKIQLEQSIRRQIRRTLMEDAGKKTFITLGNVAQLTRDDDRDLLYDAERGLGGVEFFDGGGYGDDYIGGTLQQLERFIGLPSASWMSMTDPVGPQDNEDYIAGRSSATDYSFRR